MRQYLDENQIRRLAQSIGRRYGPRYFYAPFLSAAIAARRDKVVPVIISAALNEGVTPRLIDEVILQSHLFLGFPAMIEASRVFADMKGNHRRSDRLPEAYSARECREWNVGGTAKIRKIYGSSFDRLVTYINSFSPQILAWMINDGYGQVLSRPGASFRLRELAIVATLTVTAYENQLWAHVRGALKVGVAPALIEKTIGNCRYFCPQAKITSAQRILSKAVLS